MFGFYRLTVFKWGNKRNILKSAFKRAIARIIDDKTIYCKIDFSHSKNDPDETKLEKLVDLNHDLFDRTPFERLDILHTL